MRCKRKQRQGERYDAHADHRAFCRGRRLAGPNATWQCAIAIFLSMVLARRQQRLECPFLLLHKLGAVQGNNVRQRRELCSEPILPCTADTTAAPCSGEAASSPARPNGSRELARAARVNGAESLVSF